jgi:hypothetical protein
MPVKAYSGAIRLTPSAADRDLIAERGFPMTIFLLAVS